MEAPTVLGCGDIVDWSVWGQDNTEDDSAFGEWSSVGSKSEGTETSSASSSFLVSDHLTEVESGDVKMPWLLQVCFQVFSESVEADCAIPSLSQLLQNTPASPSQPSGSICDSASLWSRLLTEPRRLRLSEKRPSLHSNRGLISALRITAPDNNTGQCVPLSLEDYEETERPSCPSTPAGPLIQTKLLAPSSCQRDTPAFLYQISQQWLAQCSLQLQPQHCKKALQ